MYFLFVQFETFLARLSKAYVRYDRECYNELFLHEAAQHALNQCLDIKQVTFVMEKLYHMVSLGSLSFLLYTRIGVSRTCYWILGVWFSLVCILIKGFVTFLSHTIYMFLFCVCVCVYGCAGIPEWRLMWEAGKSWSKAFRGAGRGQVPLLASVREPLHVYTAHHGPPPSSPHHHDCLGCHNQRGESTREWMDYLEMLYNSAALLCCW